MESNDAIKWSVQTLYDGYGDENPDATFLEYELAIKILVHAGLLDMAPE